MRLSTADATRIGPPRLYTSVSASPDKQHLLVSYLKRPYSFLVPCGRFPKAREGDEMEWPWGALDGRCFYSRSG